MINESAYDLSLANVASDITNVGAEKYWVETLRPILVNFNKQYHSDLMLNRTFVEIINHCDSAVNEGRWDDVEDSFQPFLDTVGAKNYFLEGPIKLGSKEEKDAVRNIVHNVNDMLVIMKYESDEKEEKKPIKERLNYSSPNGENMDTFDNLGPKPNKDRLPNVETEKYNF